MKMRREKKASFEQLNRPRNGWIMDTKKKKKSSDFCASTSTRWILPLNQSSVQHSFHFLHSKQPNRNKSTEMRTQMKFFGNDSSRFGGNTTQNENSPVAERQIDSKKTQLEFKHFFNILGRYGCMISHQPKFKSQKTSRKYWKISWGEYMIVYFSYISNVRESFYYSFTAKYHLDSGEKMNQNDSMNHVIRTTRLARCRCQSVR